MLADTRFFGNGFLRNKFSETGERKRDYIRMYITDAILRRRRNKIPDLKIRV
jgi:hypothetical protein